MMRPVLALLLSGVPGLLAAQTPARAPAPEQARRVDLTAATAALRWRSIGPALMSGRIADVAVHPRDPRLWYVASGSGGVWKTTNAGTTFTPTFDDQPSYSIGVVTVDPTAPDVVWVGTGENVSGRHVGWGDGVYRSRDAGRSWQRMGLSQSQHIGRILVDPRDGKRVLVAAEGPLWSAGGDRGVFRSEDGGATWTQTLAIDENTGVTDLEFDPSNPDVVYGAGYQRRRHVWGFLAGGPKTGIWKSTDNGKSWRPLTRGLPTGDMGKIGLAVTAADPARVYATIEASRDERGFYVSMDRGESWEKRNSYISGGTGPHYYQEIEASPTDPDLVYQMDVFLNVTRDAGRTFSILETGHDKHSDNHALWIDPADGRHLLVGTDAGLYESFDEGTRWRHFPNIPVAQLYKVAVNDREPFYDVLTGAQDQGTLFGPSRTLNQDGIRNHDWYVPLGADGYGVAFSGNDPDLMYLMWQEGNLYRKDRRNEEGVAIRPYGAPSDPPERWNWDSPLLVSPHRPDRIYYGSQRLWRSDDRGDSWTAISGDLTLGADRYTQSFFGRTWSVDALHDNGAMSKYATLTSAAESPRQEGHLVVGTDDGLVQVSANGGQSWSRAGALPGLPPRSFVNDVEFSAHDARTIFVAADAHKIGDFTPFLFASSDLGQTWRSITGDLPTGAIVWALQQDHERPELLFAGTEAGVYWSPNGGANWHRLASGMPTISVRDLKVQRRDGDLVAATFGRGIYVLDDYTPLRRLAENPTVSEGVMPVRDAWWFVPHQVAQAPGRAELGSDDFTLENPPTGALITYHLGEIPPAARETRQANERALRARGADVPFPGYERLGAEATEGAPRALIAIANAAGERVRLLDVPARAGTGRASWDLRGPSPDAVDLSPPGFRPPWATATVGPLVSPGRYTATLLVVSGAGVRTLGSAQTFTVKPLMNVRADFAAVAAFQAEVAELRRQLSATNAEIDRLRQLLRHARVALVAAPRAEPTLLPRADSIEAAVSAIARRLSGDPARQRLSQSDVPSVASRINDAASSWDNRQLPTQTQRAGVAWSTGELAAIRRDLRALVTGDLARFEAALEAAGAPWTPGRRPSP
jgi:photosystem II stability/assembly factor-like uncharacterized protein